MDVVPLSVIDRECLTQVVLPTVTKPGRYLGLEHGACRKDPSQARVRMAMVFPDLYEIGVSNYGHKLLYSHVNNQPHYRCDRAYALAKDMRQALRDHDIPLYGMETLIPLKDFDLLAFTLQYELNYTTILGILDDARIPLHTRDRADGSTPLLIAGGPGSANPMPLSPFLDAFILGDGEDVLLEILALVDEAKTQGWSKVVTREQLSRVEGVFVPGISTQARKRIVDITQQDIDLAPLIPHIQTVHDRVTVEARRGCDRMCRFCQPCFINLPVREQKIPKIREQALAEIAKTGYEECSLLSLSIADYSQLKPLIHEVADALHARGVSLSLPSQRADRFDLEVAQAVQQVRKSTLTFAPEAGTERLRTVLNKNLTEPEILKAVTSAYQAGWNKVKLYFMIGLPTETEADLVGIVELVHKMQTACAAISRDRATSQKSGLAINVTFSNFVPKPHTPFQWAPQDSLATLHGKREFLKAAFRGTRGVKLNFTDPEISKLEAVISRGDARLAEVILKAYEKGGYLDAWEENLTFSEWFEALNEVGIDPDHYTAVTYTRLEEPLPWDGIDVGLERDWLVGEYRKSLEETESEPCFVGCNTCGVCHQYDVAPVFMKPSELAVMSTTSALPLDRETLFPMPTTRVRLTIEKRGNLQFISHLDWLRMLHRAISRAQLPIAYSQGFNPTPRLSFGLALPMFTEGCAEYVDLDMVHPVEAIVDRLNPHLPVDGKVLEAQWIGLSVSSLDKMLRYLRYASRWTCRNSLSRYTVSEQVHRLLDQPAWYVSVPAKGSGRGRKSSPGSPAPKRIDIKPLIDDIDVDSLDIVQYRIRVDRQYPLVKSVWFLNLVDPAASWSTQRLQVILEDTVSPQPTPLPLVYG